MLMNCDIIVDIRISKIKDFIEKIFIVNIVYLCVYAFILLLTSRIY